MLISNGNMQIGDFLKYSTVNYKPESASNISADYVWCSGRCPFCKSKITKLKEKRRIVSINQFNLNQQKMSSMKRRHKICITCGSKSSDNRMFDDLMSLWITGRAEPLCRYSKASDMPTATLYLSLQPNASGSFLFPDAEEIRKIGSKLDTNQRLNRKTFI